MGRLEQTNAALDKIAGLREMLSSFEQNCVKLLSSIHNDEFLEKELACNVNITLDKIIEVQGQLGNIYEELFKGSMPCKISEADNNIGVLKDELCLKHTFIEAVNFFEALHSYNEIIEVIIQESREKLLNFDMDSMTVDETKAALQKFVDFKLFFEGKHELLLSVAKEFHPELVIEAAHNTDFYFERTQEEDNTPENSDEKTAMEAAPADVAGGAMGQDAEPKATNDEGDGQQIPVSAPGEEAAQTPIVQVDEKEDRAEQEKEAEAVAQPKVEAEAKAELEREAVTKSEGDDEPETEHEAEGESEPEVKIVVPQNVYSDFKVKPLIQRFEDKEQKRITSGVAQREAHKICLNRDYKRVMGHLANRMACSLSSYLMYSNIDGHKPFDYYADCYAYASNTMNKLGYSIKYDCGKYGIFYCITDRGFKAINYITMTSFKANEKKYISEIIEEKGYELILLDLALADMLADFKEYGRLPDASWNYDKDANCIIIFAEYKKDDIKVKIAYFAINSNQEEHFLKFYKHLQEEKAEFAESDIICVGGFVPETCKAILAWAEECIPEEFGSKKKYYYCLEDKKLYSYEDDAIITSFGDIIDFVHEAKHEVTAETVEAGVVSGDVVSEESEAQQEESTIPPDISNISGVQEEPAVVDDSASVVKPQDGIESPVGEIVESEPDRGHGEALPNIASAAEHEDVEAVSQVQEQNDPVQKAAMPDAIPMSMEAGISEVDKKAYWDTYKNILATRKIYAASAYLKKLSDMDDSFRDEYIQLAYAVNDPLAECTYNSKQIMAVYLNIDNYNSYFMIAAMLRNFYANQNYVDYRYDIDALLSAFESDDVLLADKNLKRIVNAFGMFKSQYQIGMSRFAENKNGDTSEQQAKLAALAKNAIEEKTHSVDFIKSTPATNARVIGTLTYFFDRNSELISYLDVMGQKEISEEIVSMLREYAYKNFIRDNAELAVENINKEKINALIDYGWQTAGKLIKNKKATDKMKSTAYSRLFNRLFRIATIMCDYIQTAQKLNNAQVNDDTYSAYNKVKKEVSESLKEAIAAYKQETSTGCENYGYKIVLLRTLQEIAGHLAGKELKFTGRYYYLPFLGDDHVLLDDQYHPALRDIQGLPVMSALACIEKHAMDDSLVEESIQRRINGLLENDEDFIQSFVLYDNYGTLKLLLSFIDSQKPGFEEKFIETYGIDRSAELAAVDMKRCFSSFSDNMELYQSYGQIDNTEENKKEIILQTAGLLYEDIEENKNYGFLRKVLNEFEVKIQEEAKIQGINLRHNLDVFLSTHPKILENAQAAEVVECIKHYIENQKYSSAEELLNRLENDDYDNAYNSDDKDYLQEFLSHYDSYFKKVMQANKTLQQQFSISQGRNKEQKVANNLYTLWPKGSFSVNETNLAKLLEALGFKVGSVKKQPVISNKYLPFFVKLTPAKDGRKNNYNHPIPAFGSLAETDGFRVVYIFGSYDADGLVEIFQAIGEEQHTLVVLDAALKENERRKLARLVKVKANGKIFAVLDRVVIKYLIDKCLDQTINININKQMLSIIMPYAYYQPYVAESSKAMPAEIFIGRKEELHKIKDPNGINIVYGGRQLGKSALLLKAKNDIDRNESGDRAVYVDIKGLDYAAAAKKISEELEMADILDKDEITDDWHSLSLSIRTHLSEEKNKVHYFLLLLDEADAFLKSCEDVNYKPFEELKAIQTIGYGRFKFVVAGLRDVVRFNRIVALKDNSVLPQLSSITVKPFKYAEARELLEYPLRYLGFRFSDNIETDTLISAILSHTNSFPGMIQLYCTKLIEAMKNGYAGYSEANTPPYYVSENHIKKVLGEKHLQTEIRDKFAITLHVGQDNYYYLIAMITAYLYNTGADGITVTPEDVLDFARSYCIDKLSSLTTENITALMEEMKELNVLQHNGKDGYRFTHFSFYQMMGTKADLDDKLFEYMGGGNDE